MITLIGWALAGLWAVLYWFERRKRQQAAEDAARWRAEAWKLRRRQSSDVLYLAPPVRRVREERLN